MDDGAAPRALRTLTQPEAMRLKAEVDRDKLLVKRVRASAERYRASRSTLLFDTDITGRSPSVSSFNMWQRDFIRTVQDIERDLFFARITTRVRDGRSEEGLTLLVTRSNGGGGSVYGDDWNVVSWTDPISASLLDSNVGDQTLFVATRADGTGRPTQVTYVTEATARFGSLEPEITNSRYRNRDGSFYVVSEEALIEPVIALPIAPPPQPYRSAIFIGLDDLIEEADRQQRLAMHLPFADNILIDGPPGSGKTSIGIMRVPCLLFQQWEATGRHRDHDAPFHTRESMRVLVYGEEMTEYLATLVRSLRTNIVVESTHKFLAKIGRSARTLSGAPAKEPGVLAALKGQREIMPAYWAGFQQNTLQVWADERDQLKHDLVSIGPDGGSLFGQIEEWVRAVEQHSPKGHALSSTVNLAERLSLWLRRRQSDLPGYRTVPSLLEATNYKEDAEARVRLRAEAIAWNENARAARHALETFGKKARNLIRAFTDRCVSRAAIWREMFKTPQFMEVRSAALRNGMVAREVEDAMRTWSRQAARQLPPSSEADAAICAWLGSHVMLTADEEGPLLLGGRRVRLSHLMVDEIQDLSPCHVPILASLLVREGTMTLVGDVHQSLRADGNAGLWKVLNEYVQKHRTFGIAYRQSAELGSFVHGLHSELFAEIPAWKPSESFHGPVPTADIVDPSTSFAAIVAERIREVREDLPEATVGVLYHGRPDPKALRRFAKAVERELSDTSIPVYFSPPGAGGARLREADCAIVASVRETKGMEFDAVIFVSGCRAFQRASAEIPTKYRNALYVAASRARYALKFVLRAEPLFLRNLESVGSVVVRRSGGGHH